MTGAGRLYVPLAALALAAMAGRAGWIDWPAVVHGAATGMTVAVGMALILSVPAGILAGLAFLALKVADWLLPDDAQKGPPAP